MFPAWPHHSVNAAIKTRLSVFHWQVLTDHATTGLMLATRTALPEGCEEISHIFDHHNTFSLIHTTV